ncbi:MAG: peptidoglycan DD-metalloendopeptidase family protein [Balneolales bacterium]|nr:peptidoglycan DD-metalloendopeptidase family protein [Balneolales bacterium]
MLQIRILTTAIVLLLLMLSVSANKAYAQNFERMRTEVLQQQRETRETIDFLRQQISRIETQVTETVTEYNQLYRQFEEVERELNLRNEIVVQLEEERRQITREISILEQSYKEYEEDLNRMKEEYKRFLTQVYKQGQQNEIMLLITSESLSQAQIRAYYLAQFRQFRERQAEQIREVQQELEVKREELVSTRERNQQVLAESRQERNRMQQRRQQQENTIARLQENRRALEQQLSQSRQEMEDLSSLFSQLIAEEERIRKAEEARYRELEAERQRQLAEARRIEDAALREREVQRLSAPVRRSSEARFTEDEIRAISTAFAQGKGSLPWPTDTGVISRRFGNYIHPVLRTSTQNPGIHITTEPRSQVRAVHDGFVMQVIALNGFDDMIFVNHGDYVTAYANLTEVNVRRNSQVRAGDIIGLSGDERSSNGAALVFIIRDGDRFVDPEQWISRRPRPVP